MSETYSLVCHDTKETLWIGQGYPNMRVFYSADPDTVQRLGRFLSKTFGKPLVVVADTEVFELGYKEFEDTPLEV